ncbi:MAG: acetylglutamate kinase [Nitrospirae bacterium]|nr:acetylglutamate kinase [Nitrospirota bacterium]MBF0542737.1 acetylglutamate kinase [Nitrospirota bacterium]
MEDNNIGFDVLKQIISSRARELEFAKYIQRFNGKTIVVKYGGSALEGDGNISSLIDDLIFLKQQHINVVLIHGGSKHLNKVLKDNNIESVIIDGIRVTTKEVLTHAINVFKEVNRMIVSEINNKGKGEIKAIGLNGSEIPITISEYLDKGKYHFVGRIVKVNPEYLNALRSEYIPVISSLSQSEDNQILNVNADTHAVSIAVELKAEKYINMTNTDGILDETGKLIPSMNLSMAEKMLESGVISKGMVPKIKSCLKALENNVNKVHIINGTFSHALAREIFTDEGIGTEIVR